MARTKRNDEASTTTAPIAASAPAGLEPEFLRTEGVEALFGIKRGTLYNLEADGRVRGVLLRVRGSKSGVRLWSVDSIRKLLRAETGVANG